MFVIDVQCAKSIAVETADITSEPPVLYYVNYICDFLMLQHKQNFVTANYIGKV